jgi:IS30 family transposase
MTRRGRKRRLVLEDEYWKLILEGVPTVEACRQIGIGRKTGYRWRAEAGGLPPGRVAEETRSSRYLSLLERQRIATLRERGHGVREIARRLGRAPSTVSRELRRHLKPHDKGLYDADLAHARARDNARRQRAGTLVLDPELRELVKDKLEDTWSPQQISAWLRTEHPDRLEWHVCHETIYHALYLGRKGGLSRALTAKLRTGRPLRKRRRRVTERTPRYIAPAVLIHCRPTIVETRTRIGDWEGDLIVGKHSRSAIGTLVDRTSRSVRLIHLPHGHSADTFIDAISHVLAALPEAARRTLTWDQGSEMGPATTFSPSISEKASSSLIPAARGRPVGKFCAVLPITNRLRFGRSILTQCVVQPLAHNPLQAQFLSSAENDGGVDVGPRRRH